MRRNEHGTIEGHPGWSCRWSSVWGAILVRGAPKWARNSGLEAGPRTSWPGGWSVGLGGGGDKERKGRKRGKGRRRRKTTRIGGVARNQRGSPALELKLELPVGHDPREDATKLAWDQRESPSLEMWLTLPLGHDPREGCGGIGVEPQCPRVTFAGAVIRVPSRARSSRGVRRDGRGTREGPPRWSYSWSSL